MRAKKEIEYQSEKKQFVFFIFIFSRIDFSGNGEVRKWV